MKVAGSSLDVHLLCYATVSEFIKKYLIVFYLMVITSRSSTSLGSLYKLQYLFELLTVCWINYKLYVKVGYDIRIYSLNLSRNCFNLVKNDGIHQITVTIYSQDEYYNPVHDYYKLSTILLSFLHTTNKHYLKIFYLINKKTTPTSQRRLWLPTDPPCALWWLNLMLVYNIYIIKIPKIPIKKQEI